MIDTRSIIVDAKSGVSGAGRAANIASLYTECNESIKAYAVTTHRHTPEIEQELSKASGNDVKDMFYSSFSANESWNIINLLCNTHERHN